MCFSGPAQVSATAIARDATELALGSGLAIDVHPAAAAAVAKATRSEDIFKFVLTVQSPSLPSSVTDIVEYNDRGGKILESRSSRLTRHVDRLPARFG